jgi:hypothetical protein
VPSYRCSIEEQSDRILWMGVLCLVTLCNTTIDVQYSSTAPQLSISQKALGTLPEDGNVMPKHEGANILVHN